MSVYERGGKNLDFALSSWRTRKKAICGIRACVLMIYARLLGTPNGAAG